MQAQGLQLPQCAIVVLQTSTKVVKEREPQKKNERLVRPGDLASQSKREAPSVSGSL